LVLIFSSSSCDEEDKFPSAPHGGKTVTYPDTGFDIGLALPELS
jgi:hypothetical protein